MMTINKRLVLSAAIIVGCTSLSGASLYVDSVTDLHDGSGAGADFTGFSHLNIASVEVLNDATDISFTINLVGDPVATDWGKYMIAIDSVGGGDVVGNGWNRPISMASGMDYWIGSWVDGGSGAEAYSWDGAAWNVTHATYAPPSDIQVPTKDASSVTLTTSLASFGLSVNDSFTFDVFTSGGGGGDSAVDALSAASASVTDWGESYASSSSLSYTVIPEPATIGLVGMTGLSMLVIRRRLFM